MHCLPHTYLLNPPYSVLVETLLYSDGFTFNLDFSDISNFFFLSFFAVETAPGQNVKEKPAKHCPL